MRIVPITFCVFLLLPALYNAQNTGYAGKRFLIHTDVLSGRDFPRINLSGEVLLTRSSSVSFGMSVYNRDVNQKYAESNYRTSYPLLGDAGSSAITIINNPFDGRKLNLPESGRIDEKTFYAGYKYYVQQSGLPAPHGLFFSGGLSVSSMNMTGNYYRSLIQELENELERIDRSYYRVYELDSRHDYNYNFYNLAFTGGVGYTHFLTSWFLITAEVSAVYTRFDLTNELSNDDFLITSGMSHGLRTNTISAPFNRSGKGRTGARLGGIGISTFIRLGFLLF